MASMFEQGGNGTLFLGGTKISGSDIRDQNGTELTAKHGSGRVLRERIVFGEPTLTGLFLQCSLHKLSQMLSRALLVPAALTK